jgi:ATP synthase F1 complex assembly factor 1
MNFFKFSKKNYFSYPCPRKLREIMKMSLIEREQPTQIKEIWKQYYNEKPNAFGLDMSSQEMDLLIKK